MSSATAARALCALIRVNFDNFTGTVDIESLGLSEWASVTFCGARHRLCVRLEGPGAVGAAADFLGHLGERDYALPGHILADITLIAEERRDGGCYAALELEALTIEDG